MAFKFSGANASGAGSSLYSGINVAGIEAEVAQAEQSAEPSDAAVDASGSAAPANQPSKGLL